MRPCAGNANESRILEALVKASKVHHKCLCTSVMPVAVFTSSGVNSASIDTVV